ncbi:MAG: DMT family transporter [Planctomycetes bacterium]|nr:DMT family transporter [Planctomycetota bacterium]
MPYVFFVLICLIWSVSFLLMKKAALAFGPIGIAGWRCLSGAVILALVWRWRGHSWPLTRKEWPPLLGIVAVGFAWPYALQPYLVTHHGSGFVGMTMAFVPLLTIVVSIPMLRIYPTVWQVTGVVGGLGFMGLIFADSLNRAMPLTHALLAITIPLSYALSNTFLKRRFASVPPLALSLAALSLAGTVLTPAGFILPQEGVRLGPDFLFAALCLGFLGVIGTGAAMFMFYKLIQDRGPLFAGMTTYVIPVGALVWGWLDAEPLSARQVLGLAGVLGMVALVQFADRLPRVREAPALPAE